MFEASTVWKGIVYAILMMIAKGAVSIVIYAEHFLRQRKKHKSTSNNTQLPDRQVTSTSENNDMRAHDLPHLPAMLVAFAMVARGEIGFLIASLSQSSGTLGLRDSSGASAASSGQEIFLVIVWAVVICTLVGPITVGIIVRRLKDRGENPLSNW